jgi:hypothetical protein
MRPVSIHGKNLVLLLPGRDDALRDRWAEFPFKGRYMTTTDLQLATGEQPLVLECDWCINKGKRYAWCYVPGEDLMLAISKSG